MTSAELKRLWNIQSKGVACAVNLAIYLKTREKRRKPSLRKAEKEEKRLTRRGLVELVRPVVEGRAGGFCECGCGRAFDNTVAGHATWDEFYGRKHVSVEETWMLRWACHEAKGTNSPTRSYWDALFRVHCQRHGYPFRPRLTKQLTGSSK